ncbi:MAG: endonuclease [Chloroherpetonaceae bacterium]
MMHHLLRSNSLVLSLLVFLLAHSAAMQAQSFQSGVVRLSTAFLDFDLDGDTVLAGRKDSLSVWIYNGLTQPLSITDVNFGDSVFTARDTAFSVAPSDSARLWIRFLTHHNVTWRDVGVVETGSNGALAFQVKATARYSYTGTDARYRPTQNLWGSALKAQLKTIATTGFTQVGYSNRLPMFTVIDNWRVNGRGSSVDKVECVYTGRTIENFPFSTSTLANAPWNFNTEHTWPQSRFSQNEPMRSDFHHLFPTDVSENNRRSDFPFDVVTTVTNINGGSKFGQNAQGKTVYEPRDFHKGRTARAMLYFVTRYQDFGNFWNDNGVNQEAAFRLWNRQFPPDSIEIRRNNAIQTYQNNRNPFIDHPEFVERIAAFTGNADFPTAPEVAVAPLAFNFGSVAVGDSADFRFVIANQGTANLTVSVSPAPTEFVLLNVPTGLSPKTFASVVLRFKPTTARTFSEIISIATNDADEPLTTIAISGSSTLSTTPIAQKPDAFALEQNYPNPFNPTTVISYRLAQTSDVRLEVFDVLGRKIETLVQTKQSAGAYSFTFNAGRFNLSSGVYFYRLSAGSNSGAFTATQKMILAK